jgi:curved DNA-binding protein CbpA
MNFYEALNLPPSATTEEIEEAYRTLARKVHPDLNRDDPMPAEARMKLLNRVRDTLTDPKRRVEYDKELAGGSDAARVESAINETLRQSRNDALFWRRVKLTTAGGLAAGLLLGFGSWIFDFMQGKQFEPPPSPVKESVDVPVPTVTPSVPKAQPVAPVFKKKKGPEVVQFGSSTEQVLNLMGKPDQVEELPASGIRILHYGKLRLVFKNDKLVPGSGMQREP